VDVDLGLKNKVVIITGANNRMGIGAATAIRFVNEGAKVVLVYKRINRMYHADRVNENGIDRYHMQNSGDAGEVERLLQSHTAEYLILESDITDESSVINIYDAAEARFGKVDILVNNAAAYYDGDTIEGLTHEMIGGTFDVNVKGTLLMIREFVNRRGDYGRIINLSTDAAQVFAGQITYGASKAAIEAFTRSIAIEVGRYDITVNTVAPGPTQTGWFDDESEQEILPQVPLGRLGTPVDIADAILFLASERASWITGQVIKVSGGHNL
jgi:3-oxoacyl-[acyl-carrier protein] reductase